MRRPSSSQSRSNCRMSALSVAWPGGLPCPWTRGTVDTVACRESPRGKRQSQRSRPDWINRRAGSAQVPGWLVECLRLGVGHASTVRPDPSTLGVVGERGSDHESCLQLVPGSAGQALNLLQARRRYLLRWARSRTHGIVAP
jgi:hypothetical protein